MDSSSTFFISVQLNGSPESRRNPRLKAAFSARVFRTPLMKLVPQGGAARSALHLIAAWRVPLALVAAAVCLTAGVTLPIMRVSRLIVFSRPISIVDGVQILLADGDWLTATIIAVFSIIVPAAKIVALFLAWVRQQRGAPV